MQPTFDLAGLRERISLLATHVPMNACSQGPQHAGVRRAADAYLDVWERRGMDWEEWITEVQRAKATFARLIHASPDDIAVVSSLSEGASAVASALAFDGARRDVVLSDAEFPSVGQVWRAQERRGARVVFARDEAGRVPLEEYERVITSATALVSVSHAYYLNGAVNDIAAVAARAHARGALVFVDAYQAAGAFPIDVRASKVDFLATGNLKYLMGIPGIAFLYARPDTTAHLTPTVTGWFGRVNPFTFRVNELTYATGASRFDTGTPPLINAYVARAGMELILSLGVDRIRAWHEVLGARLIAGGRARGLTLHGDTEMARKTANTAFVVANAPVIEQRMRARGVIASARGPVIRLAPHCYSSLEDIERTLDVLKASLEDEKTGRREGE